MITAPNGKNLMNLQESVQWLLNNNALPFQCTANYVAGAEIGLGTIVNPSPAKVRVGSLIFFADSKVSTVIAITSNSFICSDEYNDLVDDIVYVSNVQQNASGHLIVTLSNGTDIDAGLIKQVSSFSINGSQHLIVTYNDGSTTDLGAIFTGNLNISGNITATGSISAPAVTGDSIIENMTGYAFYQPAAVTGFETEVLYASCVKNGNKITLVSYVRFKRTAEVTPPNLGMGTFVIPVDLLNNLVPTTISGVDVLDLKSVDAFFAFNNAVQKLVSLEKSATYVTMSMRYGSGTLFTLNTDYYVRYECTLLVSANMAA